MFCESGFALLVKPAVTHKQTQPFQQVGFACRVPDVYIHFSLGSRPRLSALCTLPHLADCTRGLSLVCCQEFPGSTVTAHPRSSLVFVHSVSSEDGSALHGQAVLCF